MPEYLVQTSTGINSTDTETCDSWDRAIAHARSMAETWGCSSAIENLEDGTQHSEDYYRSGKGIAYLARQTTTNAAGEGRSWVADEGGKKLW